MSNYPDDIGNFDEDPRSPFYEDNPECPECNEEMIAELNLDKKRVLETFHCLNSDCPKNEN